MQIKKKQQRKATAAELEAIQQLKDNSNIVVVQNSEKGQFDLQDDDYSTPQGAAASQAIVAATLAEQLKEGDEDDDNVNDNEFEDDQNGDNEEEAEDGNA
ncbi:MAG: hypothetical protein EZS28_049111, partial [Streblomastix strix]